MCQSIWDESRLSLCCLFNFVNIFRRDRVMSPLVGWNRCINLAQNVWSCISQNVVFFGHLTEFVPGAAAHSMHSTLIPSQLTYIIMKIFVSSNHFVLWNKEQKLKNLIRHLPYHTLHYAITSVCTGFLDKRAKIPPFSKS